MTERVSYLLKESDWKNVIKDKTELEGILRKENYPVFDKVVDFHLKYGGLTIYTGKEPITFGIHHLTKRGEFNYISGEIEGFDFENDYPKMSFLCADTLCQIRWTIDENGHIFEDFDLLTESFESFLEDYALWNELVKDGWRVIERNVYGKDLNLILDKFDSIFPVSQIQEPGIKWFKIDSNKYLIERNTEIIVFGKDISEIEKQEIIEKVK